MSILLSIILSCAQASPWMPAPDKAAHFGVSYCMTDVGYMGGRSLSLDPIESFSIAATGTLLAGCAKEWFVDKAPDNKDLLAGMAGIGFWFLAHWLFAPPQKDEPKLMGMEMCYDAR